MMATNADTDHNQQQLGSHEQEEQSNDSEKRLHDKGEATDFVVNSIGCINIEEDGSIDSEFLQRDEMPTDKLIESDDAKQISPAMGHGVDGNLSGGNSYSYEDEVFGVDKKGRVKFGLVAEATYSDDEDNDDVLMKGEVRVTWYPEGKMEVKPEGAIALADRTLMPGDVVRRLVSGKDTQRGYCRDISMYADVRVLGTKYVIKNVMTERLRPVNKWQRDSAVCLDSWVGSTKNVEEKVILRSTVGALIEVSNNKLYGFRDYNPGNKYILFNSNIVYPGNVIVGRLPSLDDVRLLTPNIPIYKNKKGKHLTERYIIESVETDSVWVHWHCKTFSEENGTNTSMLEQPNSRVRGEDLLRLKRLNLFESCMVQINDRNYLKFSNLDSYIRKSQWEKEQASRFKEAIARIQKTEFDVSSGQINAGSNSSHPTEKTKNKSTLIDADSKNAKPKKNTVKTEKLSSSNNREKTANETSVDHSESTSPPKKTSKTDGESEWVTDDDDDDDDDDLDDDEDDFFNADLFEDRVSTTTCSSPSPEHSPKHSKRHLLKKKSKVPANHSSLMIPEFQPKDGDELVTDVLWVYSTATVVWQDGTVEAGISSRQLYPIHHLDNHDFFPGDFVVCSKEGGDMTYRDYGVVQMVNHQGRTARVKWFTTYTSADEPRPKYNGEKENSVYDLKDHPDFQYRPGTIVIRVANFVGENATCTTGQIIDNFIDGRAKVWWVDGHISMCWPQDLFDVGQHDHVDWGHESVDSWETDSENSEFGGRTPRIVLEESHILTSIERTRIAIARLEEIFTISPNLQNAEVMHNLLNVYKGSRFLDRLMNTSFFHEDNFQGLIGRVRKDKTQSITERAQDRKNRLFSYVQATSPNVKHQAVAPLDSAEKTPTKPLTDAKSVGGAKDIATTTNTSKEYAPKIFNISPTPFQSTSSGTDGDPSGSGTSPVVVPLLRLKSITSISAVTQAPSTHNLPAIAEGKRATSSTAEAQSSVHNNGNADSETSTDGANITTHQKNILAQNNQLLSSAMFNIERAFEKTYQLKSAIASSQADSGNCSRNENCDDSSTSYSDFTNGSVKVNDDQNSISCSSIEFNEDTVPEMDCVRLCALLKEQLAKCVQHIREIYFKGDNINLSEVFSFEGIKKTQIEEPMDVDEEKSTEGKASETSTIEDKQQINLPKSDPVAMSTSAEANTCISTKCVDSLLSSPIEPTHTPNKTSKYFQVLPQASLLHMFQLAIFHPNNTQQYYRAVQREHQLLKTSLPPGIWVKVFEDRMDLVSVMIEGPKNTPYEDGLFFFDFQLGRQYPKIPPFCHYVSYCSDRLNPNLYEEGKVCISLLGTWAGHESEMWGENSTLLQLFVSIQGLILVPEPYFNEAGYEKQKGTQQGRENSRMYNEMVIIKMVQSSTKIMQQPPELFRQEIFEHWNQRGPSMYERLKGWMELSKVTSNDQKEETTAKNTFEETHQSEQTNMTAVNTENLKVPFAPPDFPLVPASRGFCLTLADLLETFNSKLVALRAERKLSVEKSDTLATERHIE